MTHLDFMDSLRVAIAIEAAFQKARFSTGTDDLWFGDDRDARHAFWFGFMNGANANSAATMELPWARQRMVGRSIRATALRAEMRAAL